MINIKKFTIINSLLIVLLIISVLFNYVNAIENKIVWVDKVKLFNEFYYTKDLKIEADKEIKIQQRKLDSLFSIYKIIENKKSEQANLFKIEIQNLDRHLQDIQKKHISNINTQVWSRLNTLIRGYGEENELKIILGSDNFNYVMYSRKDNDITNHLIEFVNIKYENGY